MNQKSQLFQMNLSFFAVIFFLFNTLIMYGQKDIGIQLYSLINQLDQNADRALKLIDHWGLKYIEGCDS